MNNEKRYWIIEIYSNDTANVSVISKEEVDARKKIEDLEDWMWASTEDASEDDMIERAEDRGYEHDPW